MSSKIIIEGKEFSEEYKTEENLYCKKEIDEYLKAKDTLSEKRLEFYNKWKKEKGSI